MKWCSPGILRNRHLATGLSSLYSTCTRRVPASAGFFGDLTAQRLLACGRVCVASVAPSRSSPEIFQASLPKRSGSLQLARDALVDGLAADVPGSNREQDASSTKPPALRCRGLFTSARGLNPRNFQQDTRSDDQLDRSGDEYAACRW